jgi:hypothetical protein
MFARMFAAALSLGALATTAANAAIVFSDNFDGYADQAAFQAAWPVVGAQPSTTLSNAQSVSAPNSVLVPASTTTADSPRNGRSFTESTAASTTQQLVWSFDFFDAAPVAAPYRQHANLQDGTGPTLTNQLVAMGMNNNQLATSSGGQYYMGRILGYTPAAVDPDGGPGETGTLGSGAFFKLNDFGAPHRSAGWHNLKVIISSDDGVSSDYAFYVDGVLRELVSNVGVAGSLRSYEHIRIGSGVSSPQLAHYDNFVLEAVPEPTALALLGLGGAGLLMRRRRTA